MSFKYVGRVTSFQGKSLFEILLRLKNYGVGRIVYRNRFMQNYAQPSYYVITRVEPDPEPSVDPQFSQISTAWGYKVFRGEKFGESVIRSGYKSDWQLVPRAEEEEFLSREYTPREIPVIPDYHYFPPLLEQLIIQEKKQRGEDVTERPMYSIDIRKYKGNVAMLESEAKLLEESKFS